MAIIKIDVKTPSHKAKGEIMIQKVISVLKSEDRAQRIILAANKSPIQKVLWNYAKIRKLSQYREFKRLLEDQILSSEEKEIAKNLKTNGYVKIPPQFVEQRSLKSLAEYGRKRKEKVDVKDQKFKKDFWVYLNEPKENLHEKHPIVEFAIQEPLLKIVSAAMGEAPGLLYSLLTLSRYTSENLKVSQLWHQDQDAAKVIKLFVYLNDVESTDDGPFTFFDKDSSKSISTGFFMKHTEDKKVFAQVKEDKKKEIFGKSLSCFLVNTRECYHMGSRMGENRQRLLYTAAFGSLPSIYPWSEPFINETSNGANDLSPLQRSVLFHKNI